MERLRDQLQHMTIQAQLGERFRYHVYPDAVTVADALAQQILRHSQEAIKARGVFKIVLAGGTTPQASYRLLASAKTDWNRWHVFFGDERCLPADHPERNSTMAAEAWLNHCAIPHRQIHVIEAELGAEEGAARYRQQIQGVPPFDLVLLGMGEDGHTASLFPGHQHDADEFVHAIHQAPKPPSDRISLSQAVLCHTQALIVVITGAGKHQALKRWLAGESLPIASMEPVCGIDMLLDEAAISG